MPNIFAGQDLIVIALLGLVLFFGKKIGEGDQRLGPGGPPASPSPPHPQPGDDSRFVTKRR